MRRFFTWLRRMPLFGWWAVLRLFLLAVTLSLAFTTWLLATESGTQLAIGWTSAVTPNFRMQYVSGTLVGPLRLQRLAVRGNNRLAIDRLLIDWKPSALFAGELHITELQVDTLRLQRPEAPPRSAPVKLPNLALPLDIRIDQLQIATFEQVRGKQRSAFRAIELAGSWREAQLQLDHLHLEGPRWALQLKGQASTRDGWPLEADARFVFPSTGEPAFRLDGHASGPLQQQLSLQLASAGLFNSQLEGTLEALQPGLPFQAQLQAERARIPPAAGDDRAVLLENIALQGSGEITGTFTLAGQARLDTPWSAPVQAGLRATGSWRGMEKLAVDIDDPKLKATLTTNYGWLDGQRFAGKLDLRHLDLALVNPALHSKLAGKLRIQGEIPPANAGKSTRVDIRVDELAGEALARRDLVMRGPLRWQDGLLHFDDFSLQQQDNEVLLRGTLGAQWNANAALTLPQLAGLLPGFDGSGRGTAQVAGAPADPHFALRLELQQLLLPRIDLPAPLSRPLHLPPSDWALTGEATLRDIHILETHTVDAPHTLLARGTVGWSKGLDWDLQLRYADLALAQLVDDIFYPNGPRDGRVSGTLDTRGRLDNTLESLAIDLHARGALSGEALAADGGLRWQAAGLQVDGMKLVHGENSLDVDGGIDGQQLGLRVNVNAPVLANSLRDVSGSLVASLQLDGTREAPDIQASIDAAALVWQDWSLERLHSRLQLARGGHEDSALELYANRLQLQAADEPLPPIDGLQVSLRGNRQQHALSFAGSSGPLALALSTEGSLASDHWRGTLDSGSVDINDWHWETRGRPPLLLQFADRMADARLDVDPHCWTDGNASVCLSEPSIFGRDGQLALEVLQMPLQQLLAIQMPLDSRIEGSLDGKLSARWQQGRLQQLAADIRNGAPLQVILDDDGDGKDDNARRLAQFNTLHAQAALAAGRWQTGLQLEGSDSGRINAGLVVEPDQRLDGHFNITGLRPDFATAFLYQVRNLGGTLDAGLTLDGTLQSPQLHGKVQLRDGRFTFTRLPLGIEQLQLDGEIDGSLLRLGGSFLTPDSREPARLGGEFRLVNRRWIGKAQLSGKRLQVGQAPQYRFSVSPEVTLELTPDELLMNGEVQVPEGRVELKKLPVQSVKLSPDVVNIRETQAAEPAGYGIRQRVDLNLLLGEDIYFRALGGEGRLTGNLRLRSTPLLPLRLDGELYVKDGKYRAFGQDLLVRRGVVLFNGPADRPLVEGLAVRELNDPSVREVGVQLSGPLHAPQTTLWSATDMPPEQTLAWLATGQPPAPGSGKLSDEATQAALSMGLAQGSVLLTEAGQLVGLRDVQLSSSGSGEESEMQVGTHVGDRVYVGYNQRVFTGESSVLMRLQLNRRLMLEALSGIESAVDIFYTFEF